MHIDQVDHLVVGERRKADRRAVHRGDQRELRAEPACEGFLVVGRGGPGPLLVLAVIVRRQFLDAGTEDFRQQRRILDEERPQREGRVRDGAHRAGSQVVPSLLSFSTMPSASKFVADAIGLGEVLRLAGIEPRRDAAVDLLGRDCKALVHGARANPRSHPRGSRKTRACRRAPCGPRRCCSACISAIAFGVLRSSHSASSTPGAGRASASAAAASKKFVERLLGLLQPLHSPVDRLGVMR